MKKVLIFGMNENPGGVESFLMNYVRRFDQTKLHVDFLCNSMNPIAYEEELVQRGASIFHITARSQNPFKYYGELRHFFKEYAKDYDALWVNINSLANIDYLKQAKKYGIPVRIVHSHNSQNMDSRLRGKLHNYNKKRISKWTTDFWACSDRAAAWFYEGEALRQAKIIPNAIDIEASRFSETARQSIRQQYGLQDAYVIGHVGRLHFQKNQEFILRVFAELVKVKSQARLVLIGQGDDEAMLKALADGLGVADKVIFAGVQKNVSEWLSVFDLFFFPSKFEGLPLAPFEAQANGLPVLVSEEGVPQEIKINPNVYFASLEKSPKEWAELIEKLSEQESRLPEQETVQHFQDSGYDIRHAAQELENNLLKMLTQRGRENNDAQN
ncbi:glycosyltransferase family 1 protein [Streptococcus tangpeifui]|uniref:glycosyltransferase family 1 protein n=1 Tax=Streptococcus tangpeifui TaxID=2709400 RepID=UPI0013E9C950|nr:glycosyltransferase family 1 protein [Streptococcus sp. ZJ1593]